MPFYGCFAAYTSSVTFGDSFAYLQEKPLRLRRCKQKFTIPTTRREYMENDILIIGIAGGTNSGKTTLT
ncbi:MAG: hypothetical protein IKY59_07305, partial [Oscillospiraceae bacterium]|nr:hypothetical protein [Oscillospiraceae bacterium]